jgi:hypothetical protein
VRSSSTLEEKVHRAMRDSIVDDDDGVRTATPLARFYVEQSHG